MPPEFSTPSTASTPINLISSDRFENWLADQNDTLKSWVVANGFKGTLGSILAVPNADGSISDVLLGWGTDATRMRGRFQFAGAQQELAAGCYHLATPLDQDEASEAALGWLLNSYNFSRYKDQPLRGSTLVAPTNVDAPRLEKIAAGAFLTRDLINTPANDMGPESLESAFSALAAEFGAEVNVIRGDALIEQNLPLIHAVGCASPREPRLLDLSWGEVSNPTVTLVGKGVCFDTGGLNLKPGASMGWMKKDMGGAATVMGLARIIMSTGLKVRLRVLVPAVENSVSGGAMRPGDVLLSRKGLSVEINNTDAEGRLVLADALALADESAPDYLFCMATLTGAARVALGPDLVPFYSTDDALSHALLRAGRLARDPLWRMPFWEPYEAMIEPDIADLDNAPKGGFAGSITAALFLRRFVEKSRKFSHFDIYGWTPTAAPGRPKGAAFQAARAIFEMLSHEMEP